MTQIKTLRLDQIDINGNTQFRDHINSQAVNDYAEKLSEGIKFPPLLVVSDGTTNWLVDGYHRYHASKKVGFRDVQAEVTYGTQLDAQVLALGVNSNHGLQRDGMTKRKVVEAALIHPHTKDKSDREIARICGVSHPFVAGVRCPSTKARQDETRTSRRKMETVSTSAADSTGDIDPIPRLTDYYGPDEAELRANELAEQAEREMFNKMLDADDALATAYEEIKRLQHLNAQKEIRIAALMTEKNEAIKDAKRAQAQYDKLRKSNRLSASASGHF
jgi:hypothetical protein